MAAYLFALMGAAAGAITAFVLVGVLPAPVDEREEEFDIYGGDPIRRRSPRDSIRKARSRDDFEQDRPARQPRRDVREERFTDNPRPRPRRPLRKEDEEQNGEGSDDARANKPLDA